MQRAQGAMDLHAHVHTSRTAVLPDAACTTHAHASMTPNVRFGVDVGGVLLLSKKSFCYGSVFWMLCLLLPLLCLHIMTFVGTVAVLVGWAALVRSRLLVGPSHTLQHWFYKPVLVPDPKAWIAMRLLVQRFGADNVFLVSKAGDRMQASIRHALETHGFFVSTGVCATHLIFVQNRRDKRAICIAQGITHFVDDRWSVLCHLLGVCKVLYAFPSSDAAPKKPLPSQHTTRLVLCQYGWSSVLRDTM